MITEQIEKILTAQTGYNLNIQKSQIPDLCDFQCNDVFKLAKEKKQNPAELTQSIINNINCDYFEKVEFCKPGFINFTVSEKFLAENLIKMQSAENFGVKCANGELIFLDYGGANIAKPLHVGHLRPAIIGESVKRICEFAGNKTISDVHLGDFGLPIGQVIYKVLEDKLTKEDITLEYLDKTYPFMSALCKENDEIANACAEITRKLQDGNEEYKQLWLKIKDVSGKDVKRLYDYLDVNFDLWNGESDAYKYIDQVTNILNEKNLLERSEGALIVDVKQDDDSKEMPPLIYQKSNGAYLYGTTDIATNYQRMKDFNPSEILYFIDLRQKMHIEQVKRVCEKSGIIKNCKISFCGNGTINGTDGKPFKTRKGDAPKLDSLFAEIKDYFINSKDGNNNMSDEDLNKIVNSIIKFADLQNNRERDYIFDIKKFSNVVGKTGPYVLYTYLRINKMLGGEVAKNLNETSANKIERDLKIKLLDFENVFLNAYKLKMPNFIAEYIYDLCLIANSFYESNRLNTELDETIKNNWIYVLQLTKNLLKEALKMLIIDIPTKM